MGGSTVSTGPADEEAGITAELDAARALRNAGRGEQAVRAYGAALESAARAGSAALQAAAYVGLGRCARDRGELERALACYGKAERLLTGASASERAAAVRGRAVVHLMTGDSRYGSHLLEKSIDELHAAERPDPDALIYHYAALISPYVDMGEHDRAARAGEVAEALADRATDPEALAYLWRQRARTFTDEGRFAEAEESLERAEAAYTRLGIRIEQAQCRWARGYVYAQQGRLQDAERELEAARDTLLEVGTHLITAQVEVELADVWRRRGKPAKASALLARMLRELRGDRGAVHTAAAHHLLGTILAEAGDVGAAERHYRAALVLRHNSRLAGDLAETCRSLGDLLHGAGRTGEAIDVYRFGLTGLSRPGATTLGPGSPAEADEVPRGDG